MRQADALRMSSSVQSHLGLLSSEAHEWQVASEAGYSRRSVDSRAALQMQRVYREAQEQRNQLATAVKADLSSGVATARMMRAVLDFTVGCGCNVCPATGLLLTLVLLCGYLDDTWKLSGVAIMLPVTIGLIASILSCIGAVATEQFSEAVTDRPASVCHRQANASRFLLAGACAYLALHETRRCKSEGSKAHARAKLGAAVLFLVGAALILLQLALLAWKIEEPSSTSWAQVLAPAFVLLSVSWCVPPVIRSHELEEAAAASAACFCFFCLPTLLTAMMFVLREDGGRDISTGGMLSPLLSVASILLCVTCMVSAAAVHEGELEGSPAARGMFALACSTVCCLIAAPVAFMSLLIEVDSGDIVPFGMGQQLQLNASLGNLTHSGPTNQTQVSWFVLFIPLFCCVAFLVAIGAFALRLATLSASGQSWKMQGDRKCVSREEEVGLYV